MNYAFKTLLLWLLIAALPIQGMAAAMQASCGPAHHDALAVAVLTDAHHQDGASPSSHDDGDAGTHHSASDAALTADHPSTPHQHQSAFCSACAACCVGAVAPPSSVIFTPTYTNSELVVISPSPLVTGFIPAGLERPPKRLSA